MGEIITHTELHNKIRSGINKLADAVLVTMGPNGKTVIITDTDGTQRITKDGVSVAKAIKLKDPIENIAAQLVKEVAKKTVNDAGDGTTTSICLAQAFINTGFELMEQGISYNEIKSSLEELLEQTIKLLKESSKQLDKKDIIHVANIACNNNLQMATVIDEAFKHSDIVKVEESNGIEDTTDIITGMQLNTTYFDKSFINIADKRSIYYDKCSLIIIDGKLDGIKPISNLLNQTQTVVIIAEDFSKQVVSILKDNYNRGALNVALVKSPGYAQHRKDLLDDIAVYTGGQVLTMDKVYSKGNVMGTVSSITVTKDKTTITTDTINEATIERRNHLTTILSTGLTDNDKDLMEQRLTNLIGKLSIIKVGGKSEIEMKEKFDRYDDAIRAVQCAIEEGVVEGAGISLFYISTSLKNKFKYCLEAPRIQIEKNGAILDIGNLNKYRSLFEQNIIDPFKVTRCALENAISVAKTILSTEAVVLNEYQWS